jgi:hypothetical protein
MPSEKYVDAVVAAEYLSVSPRYLMDLARRGAMAGHPLGTGARRVWRFRLSELEGCLCQGEASLTVPSEGRAKGIRHSTQARTGQ